MPTDDGGGAGIVNVSDNQNQNTDPTNDTSNSSGGGGADLSAILSALDKDNRAFAEGKGWKDVNAIFKSHRELEKQFSSRAPAQNNPKGEDSLVPTSPEGYEFKLPEKFPTDGFYNKDLASKFQKWAHKAGLSTTTAQKLHDEYVTDFASLHSANQAAATEQFNTRVSQTFDSLTKEWGGEKTPGFQRNLEMSRRAINNLGPDVKAALKEHGFIVDKDGQEVATNAALIKAFAKVGATMFAEDSLFGAKTATENPFDPKTLNTAKQGELIRKDPELARTLIQAAGPEAQKEWGWWVAKKT